jgi:hypothetical protein
MFWAIWSAERVLARHLQDLQVTVAGDLRRLDRAAADLLPHGDVGTPERVQSEVAFAGCQAARYQFISVAIRDAFCGSRRVRQIREPCLE